MAGGAVLWGVVIAVLGLATAVPTDLNAQFWLAGSLLALLVLFRRVCRSGIPRLIYLAIISFLSVRYIAWRTLNTLSIEQPLETIAMLLLYLAEVYAVTLGLLGIFVCIEPLERRSVPLPDDPAALPEVDVLIPTYNESVELLEVTLQAAVQMRYPASKFGVYLLDDGGTTAQLRRGTSEVQAAAAGRAQALESLCVRLGVTYLTRPDNSYFKAGNLNAALRVTKRDLVAVLDADHVPARDFLEKTVGSFALDPKLFLVQTPHFFINADPVEKNLEVFTKIPSENEVFYRVMQRGLDYWNGTLFAGSAAVLRRRCLEEIGGFEMSTVTEDAETSLTLHSRGYNSAYISEPLTSGLAPESFTAFVVQRTRWATGMVQILLLKNPLWYKGLSVSQRLCYLSNCFYWLFPFARLVFLLAPTLFLIFGMHIYHASLLEIFAYTVPHYWASFRLSTFLFGKVRWPFVALLYETLQSLFTLPAICRALINPHRSQFAVTPKGSNLDTDFVSPLAPPFYILFLIFLVAFVTGAYRYYLDPELRGLVLIVLFWHLINVFILLAAFGVLAELRQRRATPRVKANQAAELIIQGQALPCRMSDVSIGGAALTVTGRPGVPVVRGDSGHITVRNVALARSSALDVEILGVRDTPQGQMLATRFSSAEEPQRMDIVALVHGDSRRWLTYWNDRPSPVGTVRGLLLLVWWGVRHSARHFTYVLDSSLRSVRGVLGLNGADKEAESTHI
jgi:cellulose synthase (UDP-forming)